MNEVRKLREDLELWKKLYCERAKEGHFSYIYKYLIEDVESELVKFGWLKSEEMTL